MNASWVSIDLMDFAVQTEEAVESAEKALKWLRSFRDTLLMEGRNSKPMPWAVELLKQADLKIAKKAIARMQGQVLKVCGKNCNVEAECVARYGEKYTSLATIMNLTADATTREDVENVTCTVNRVDLESGMSANQSGAVGKTPEIERTSASLPAPSPSSPAKKAHGEFGNVMLTDDEFAKLCEKCDDADSLVTELDQYIESQGKTKKYKSHYATLLNWSRRKAQEAKPKQGYMTSDDISKKNYEESRARLEAMFSKGRETA